MTLQARHRLSTARGEAGNDDHLSLHIQVLGISDGFQPTVTDVASDETTPSAPAALSAARLTGPLPRTATTSRLPPDESFNLRHDGVLGPINEAFRARQPTATVSSLRNSVEPEEIPYEAPSGLSFPYQMHPPNVRVTRTLSMTTTLTEPQLEASYARAPNPGYPFGLCPQNTAAGGPYTASMDAIPVGLPGISDSYSPLIRNHAEEIADIIGPDGHTEYLPPYSRYPDETYARKAGEDQHPAHTVGAAIVTAPVLVHAPVPVPAPISTPIQPISSTRDISLDAQNLEYDPPSDIHSTQSRDSAQSFSSDVRQQNVNTATRGISEKQTLKNSQLFARRKLLGIVPYWAICLLITALLMIGTVLGTVVGSFYTKHGKPPGNDGQRQPDSPPTIAVTVDATPIPTPSDLPPLPTGTFSLPLTQNKAPNSCFRDSKQAQAWSCSIWRYGSGLNIVVGSNPPGEGRAPYDISINCNQSNTIGNHVFWYGEQPPVILIPVPMQLVNDTLDQHLGTAWFTTIPFNKTVIVHETLLSAPTSTPTAVPRSKLHSYGAGGVRQPHNGFGQPRAFHRNTAVAGDKPWVCTWPDTLLEVFIYPRHNSSLSRINLNSSSLLTGAVKAIPSSNGAATASTISGAAAPTSTGFNPLPTFSQPYQPYPRVVKVEERRMTRHQQSFCVQYQLKLGDSGVLSSDPIVDRNGNPISIMIAEAEDELEPPTSPTSPPQRRDWYGDEILLRDDNDLSDCGCFWLLT